MKVLAGLTFIGLLFAVAIRMSGPDEYYTYSPDEPALFELGSNKAVSNTKRKLAQIDDAFRVKKPKKQEKAPEIKEKKEEINFYAQFMQKLSTALLDENSTNTELADTLRDIQTLDHDLVGEFFKNLSPIHVLYFVYEKDKRIEDIVAAKTISQIDSDLDLDKWDMLQQSLQTPEAYEYLWALKRREYTKVDEIASTEDFKSLGIINKAQTTWLDGLKGPPSDVGEDQIEDSMAQAATDSGEVIEEFDENSRDLAQSEGEFNSDGEISIPNIDEMSIEELEDKLTSMNYSDEEIENFLNKLEQEQ